MQEMSEDNEKLDEFLDQAAKKKAEHEEEAHRRVEGPRLFTDTFLAVAALQIKPVLHTACEPWVKRGLSAEVDVDDVSSNPSVSLVVEPNPHMRAKLIYRARLEDRIILAYRDFGPGGGEAIGNFGLNDITSEIVQSHVDDFMSEVIRLGGQ